MFEALAEDKSIKLQVLHEPVGLIYADSELLFEALSNLIDNAIKFTPAGGSVTVKLSRTDATPHIEVFDFRFNKIRQQANGGQYRSGFYRSDHHHKRLKVTVWDSSAHRCGHHALAWISTAISGLPDRYSRYDYLRGRALSKKAPSGAFFSPTTSSIRTYGGYRPHKCCCFGCMQSTDIDHRKQLGIHQTSINVATLTEVVVQQRRIVVDIAAIQLFAICGKLLD